MILNVENLLEQLNNDLKDKISKLEKKPILSTIRIGNDKSVISYEKSILKQASYIGIEVDTNIFESDINIDEIKNLIKRKNDDSDINGILIFSPVENYNEKELFNMIDTSKDVDGLNEKSIANVYTSKDYHNTATTANATLEYLKSIIDLESKDVLIINRSMIIGKPLSIMLLNENATVTVAHSKTKDLYEKMKIADIIISAVGKPEIFNPKDLKKDAIIIDLAYSIDENNKIKGDFKNTFTSSPIKYLPPVGGIGKINSNIIIRNTYLNEVRNAK